MHTVLHYPICLPRTCGDTWEGPRGQVALALTCKMGHQTAGHQIREMVVLPKTQYLYHFQKTPSCDEGHKPGDRPGKALAIRVHSDKARTSVCACYLPQRGGVLAFPCRDRQASVHNRREGGKPGIGSLDPLPHSTQQPLFTPLSPR